jgi:hypothetical protein
MRSDRKIFLLVPGAFVLCLGLPNVASAINNFAEELEEQKTEQGMQGDSPGLAEKKELAAKGISIVHGEVLGVEPDKYLVRKYDGDIVRLQIDQKTQVSGPVRQGDRIVAKVNDQEVALTITSASRSDQYSCERGK